MEEQQEKMKKTTVLYEIFTILGIWTFEFWTKLFREVRLHLMYVRSARGETGISAFVRRF